MNFSSQLSHALTSRPRQRGWNFQFSRRFRHIFLISRRRNEGEKREQRNRKKEEDERVETTARVKKFDEYFRRKRKPGGRGMLGRRSRSWINGVWGLIFRWTSSLHAIHRENRSLHASTPILTPVQLSLTFTFRIMRI